MNSTLTTGAVIWMAITGFAVLYIVLAYALRGVADALQDIADELREMNKSTLLKIAYTLNSVTGAAKNPDR